MSYQPPMQLAANDALKTLARTLFGYLGRTFQVQAHDHPYTLHDLQWGGGTKSTYVVVQGDGAYDFSTQAARFFPPSIEVEITPDTLLVEHHIFCGKDMGICLHVHPSRLPKLLPPPPEQGIGRDHLIVLTATAHFKNSYSGQTNIRYTEAHSLTGITAAEWQIARQECIASGWLLASGAITPAGRNLVAGHHLYDWKKERP